VGSPKLGRTSRLVEDETLERIRRTLENGIEGGDLGDDAATVDVPGGGPVVVSVDSVVEGVHVDLAFCSPQDVGWKALMGALSDLAAMGARPIGALVALCVPDAAGGGGGELTVGVMAGVAQASRRSGCPVVGGDVSAAGVLVVAVTVMGTLDGGVPVPRSGARAGDVILVTGPCGGSAAGLRILRGGAERATDPVGAALAAAYRRPVARLGEGEAARRAGASAMIDVSDGLALDLHRLADASEIGFTLDGVPVAEGATLEEALGGGEDYELVIVFGPGELEACERTWADAGLRPLQRIGTVTSAPAQRTLAGRDLEQLGWQHHLG
jgi:thiamine-monophosphate kinase